MRTDSLEVEINLDSALIDIRDINDGFSYTKDFEPMAFGEPVIRQQNNRKAWIRQPI